MSPIPRPPLFWPSLEIYEAIWRQKSKKTFPNNWFAEYSKDYFEPTISTVWWSTDKKFNTSVRVPVAAICGAPKYTFL